MIVSRFATGTFPREESSVQGVASQPADGRDVAGKRAEDRPEQPERSCRGCGQGDGECIS